MTNVVFATTSVNNFDVNFGYDAVKNAMTVVYSEPAKDMLAARRRIYDLVRMLRKSQKGDVPTEMKFLQGVDGSAVFKKWSGGEINDTDSDMNTDTGNAWLRSGDTMYVLCRQAEEKPKKEKKSDKDESPKNETPIAETPTDEPTEETLAVVADEMTDEAAIDAVFTEIAEGLQ